MQALCDRLSLLKLFKALFWNERAFTFRNPMHDYRFMLKLCLHTGVCQFQTIHVASSQSVKPHRNINQMTQSQTRLFFRIHWNVGCMIPNLTLDNWFIIKQKILRIDLRSEYYLR